MITPKKTSCVSTSTSTATPTSQGKGNEPYRLLYRGALSLPDSYLQLDGIAFSARLPNRPLQNSPSSHVDVSGRELMFNPLALALESMRTRPLRFKGIVSLKDVWTDDTGDVYMDIHPFATLTRIYFENILCLSALDEPSNDTCGTTRTRVGVRVSLGDTDGPETTDMVIYGETSTLLRPPPLQLSSAATSTSAGPPPLSMRVARITPAPRAPRPDDPTPRQPPTHLLGTTHSLIGDLGANKRIIPRLGGGGDKGKAREEDPVVRRAREVMLHLPRPNGNGRGKVKEKSVGKGEGCFKVPELPAKVRRKQGGVGTDVFGVVEPPQPQPADGRGKGKATAVGDDNAMANSIEDANKLVLKKTAVRCLSNAGIPRSHSEFKDFFGFVYRGAAFALRSQVKTLHVSTQAAEAVVEAHVRIYVPSAGDSHDAQSKTLSNVVRVNDTGG